jgi:hypothetical protein
VGARAFIEKLICVSFPYVAHFYADGGPPCLHFKINAALQLNTSKEKQTATTTVV